MNRRRYQRGSLRKCIGKTKVSWVAQWREDTVENGQVLRRFRKETWPVEEFPTRKLALRELERRLSSINSPTYQPTHRMVFADFATRWADTVLPMHKPSSQSSERVHLARYIRPFFDQLYLHEITPFHTQQFVSGLTGVAPKTARNIYTTFRAMWKTVQRWGLVETEACKGIRMPGLNPVERPAFTMEQMCQIVATAEEPFKTFFWLASETGLRAGELCGLRWDDIDTTQGRVQVRQNVWGGKIGTPKSNAGVRSTPISMTLAEHLEAKRPADGGLVFRTRTGKPWDARFIVRDQLQPLLKQLGIPRAGLHAFRHGNATYSLQNGEDVKTLATRLGHSDPGITLRVYTHAAHNRNMVEKIGRVLMPNAGPSGSAFFLTCLAF